MFRKSLACLLLIGITTMAQSDTLLLDGVEASAQSASARPTRGASMATVESQFGAPTQRAGAIGTPPITRWEYPEFTVFFEYDHVIHAVSRR